MNGNGYDSAIKPSAQFFTKDQRIRLEAVTVMIKLYPRDSFSTHLRMAEYVVEGK
jgi:hypothetical protein